MNNGVTRIQWRSAELDSAERFTGRRTAEGWRLDGLVVLPVGGEPSRIAYRVETDPAWRTRRVEVAVGSEGGDRRITFEATPAGGWTVDGGPVPELDGCVDVDLGFTPATNTLSIRRLAGTLALGETRELAVAWLPFPELVARRNVQSYTWLGGDRWLYRSDEFEAELVVDPDGYVLRYGDDLWSAVAHRPAA